MTKGYYEKCKNCGKDYYYESTGNIWPGGKDHEQPPVHTARLTALPNLSAVLFTHTSWMKTENQLNFDNVGGSFVRSVIL